MTTYPALLLATAIATTILPPAAYAQGIYFHSPSEQALTADFATRLAAARTAHIAVLDRHDSDLRAAMADEQSAIVRQELAQRDAVLTQQIDGDAKPLNAMVRAQLESLTNGTATAAIPALSDAAEKRFQADIGRVRKLRNEWDQQVASVRRAEAKDRLEQRQFTRCDEAALATSTDPVNPSPVPNCTLVQQTYRRLIRAVRCDQPQPSRMLLAIGAGVDRCWNSADGRAETVVFAGEIAEALQAYKGIRTALTQQSEAAAIVQNELSALQAYIDCQHRRAEQQDASRHIAAAFAQLDGFLKDVATLTDSGGAAKMAVPVRDTLTACSYENDTFRVPPVNEALSALQAILAGSQIVAQKRGIGAAAAQAAERFRASRLAEIVQAASEPPIDRSERAPGIVAALVRSAVPVEKLAQAGAGTLPDTSGALVALAEAQLRETNAAIEVDRLQRVASLSLRRLAALSNEVSLLLKADRATSPDDKTILYAASVERGRIPARVLATRIDNLEYDAWARRERAAVEAGYAALTPAAIELEAYGEGGIKSETIVRFLNVAGLAAIAGTN